ncbi:Proline racemase (EC [Olavius algarvensis associated proteobacterium Delta 3]|nr:Proline racemase (EC [Olavius algarvensis associated proteobacterium Delta 3]
MKHNRFFDVMYTHTEGEPTCIVHSGIYYPPNSDILEKRRFLEKHYSWLRNGLMREPRGHHHMFGVFLTPPSLPDTHAGMIWCDGDRFVDMCGHGTIALSMALVSHDLIPSCTGTGVIRYESTAGQVTAHVRQEGGEVRGASFENVPAFVEAQNIPVELPGYGELKADVVFGGNYFGIIKWPHKDLRISPETGSTFAELGLIAKPQLNEKLKVQHPEHPHIDYINFVTFWHEPVLDGSFYRNVHVFSDGKCDRSPGGTGTSAMMAMLEARGEIKVHQPIRSEGLLGSGQFEGELVREVTVAGKRAVVPVVGGTAHVIGYAKWLFNDNDPLRDGFIIQ